MNVAEIEMVAPPARATSAPAPETAPAEPFDRVLARRAAEARDAGPRAADHDTAQAPRSGDADAEPAEATDSVAAKDADDTTDDEVDTDDGDAKAKGAAIGLNGACGPGAQTTEPKGEGCTPGTAQAATSKATAGATPVDAKAQATPAAAPASTPSAPASGAAATDATAEATTTTATAGATPDASGTGKDSDDAHDAHPGAHRTARSQPADAKADAAPKAAAPDRAADTGLARAMQQAAAPAQAALARAAEAAVTQRHGESDTAGGGPDRADALGSTSAASDPAPRVTADLRAARTDAPRHAAPFDQVMDHTLRMVRVGQHEARLRLEPDHLGQVHVRVSMDRGHVVADLTVHTHAARDLLEGQQARLQQALLDGGADGARVNVSLGGDGGRDTPDEGPAPSETEIAATVAAEAPGASAGMPAPGPGGLSIRA